MPTIKFYGYSDDLLEAEFDKAEIEATGKVDEMSADIGGWVLTYPDGKRFAVVGEYTDRGLWRMSFDFPPEVDGEGNGAELPRHVDAGFGRKHGTPYSTFLAVVVPEGTKLEPLNAS